MKAWKQIFLIAIVVITVLSLLLSACGPVDKSNGNSNKEKNKDNGNQEEKENDGEQDQGGNANKITICHRTGSAKNPYVAMTVSVNAISDGHGTHEGDLIPAPEGGCPATVNDTEDNGNGDDNDEGGNTNKITICHNTGSAKNPYVEITVSVNAARDGHGTHAGDLIPAPEGGCPDVANSVDMPPSTDVPPR